MGESFLVFNLLDPENNEDNLKTPEPNQSSTLKKLRIRIHSGPSKGQVLYFS